MKERIYHRGHRGIIASLLNPLCSSVSSVVKQSLIKLKEKLMKKLILSLIVISFASAVLLYPAWAQNKEEAGVRQALNYYLQGHATGDGENHKKAFHPEAKLFWIRDGQFTQRTSAEYIAGSSGKPAPDERERKRWIESIDISGNAAIAKVILDYPNARFVDYMSLLKIGDEWKIVNKTFVMEPKTRPQAAGGTK
jgi:hypothetical protein